MQVLEGDKFVTASLVLKALKKEGREHLLALVETPEDPLSLLAPRSAEISSTASRLDVP